MFGEATISARSESFKSNKHEGSLSDRSSISASLAVNVFPNGYEKLTTEENKQIQLECGYYKSSQTNEYEPHTKRVFRTNSTKTEQPYVVVGSSGTTCDGWWISKRHLIVPASCVYKNNYVLTVMNEKSKGQRGEYHTFAMDSTFVSFSQTVFYPATLQSQNILEGIAIISAPMEGNVYPVQCLWGNNVKENEELRWSYGNTTGTANSKVCADTNFSICADTTGDNKNERLSPRTTVFLKENDDHPQCLLGFTAVSQKGELTTSSISRFLPFICHATGVCVDTDAITEPNDFGVTSSNGTDLVWE